MSQAIVIGTDFGREKWVANCLKSLKDCPFQIMVITQGKYELGKLKWVYENTTVQDILFLHDTVEVKDLGWVYDIFGELGSVALTNKPVMFGMYLGKYCREVLDFVPIPDVKTKEESVYYESHWTDQYVRRDPVSKVLWPELDDQPYVFEKKFGRDNLVLENEHIKKYKGTWNLEQALEIDRRQNVGQVI